MRPSARTASRSSTSSATEASILLREKSLISRPCTTSNGGEWEVVQGLEVSDFSRGRIDAGADPVQSSADPTLLDKGGGFR